MIDSKRKQGDPLDDKETAEEHPMSEDDELVNDIDEYFEAGRESKKNEQEMVSSRLVTKRKEGEIDVLLYVHEYYLTCR